MYRYLTLICLFVISLSVSAQSDSIHSTANNPTKVSSADSSTLVAPESMLAKAEKLYAAARFSEAASLFEKVIEANGPTFEVYYNLGNAYYKYNELAKAILNYERALRLNPGDSDTRFNLDICQAKTIDKIDPVGVFLVTRWFRSLSNNLNSNGWAVASLILFVLFIASLFAYFFSRLSWLKKTGFYFGIVSLILCILSLFYASSKYNAVVYPNQAILMTPTITVKSSPDQSGTDLFPLHEGTKVTITNEIGSWNEIELQDGNVGWLPASSMEVI